MSDTDTIQDLCDTAEAYETGSATTFSSAWAATLVDAAGAGPGDRVLVVGCGTGIVAELAADRVGPSGSVVGLDLDPTRLAVAHGRRPDIEWRQGDASGLPFLARSFDIVLCQASLASFSDAVRALREMGRAAKDEGTVAIQVWDRRVDEPLSGSDRAELTELLRTANLQPTSFRTATTTVGPDLLVRGHAIVTHRAGVRRANAGTVQPAAATQARWDRRPAGGGGPGRRPRPTREP